MVKYTLEGVLKLIIDGSVASNKTEILIRKCADLLNSGVSASSILVLVQNSTMKSSFQNKVLELLTVDCIEKLQIHSFFSLVYNTISDNWAYLEDHNIFDNPVILPNLAGLEVSQFLLKDILKDVKFRGYNSRMSLLHQIFRRYSLIIQNNLSQSDIDKRAAILKEGFSDEASLAIKKLLKKTLELRDFDYLRQCLMFNFVYKNTDYFKHIKYLIVDDADECTPICVDFIEFLSKQLDDFFIAIDSFGSSRCGYLSADKNNFEKFKKIFNSKSEKISEASKIYKDSENLFKNINNDEYNVLNNFSYNSFSKRSAMIESLTKQIGILFADGVKPCEISIITPVIDDMLKFTLKENFKSNINLLYLSGSEKLIQNRLVLASITILKLNTELKKSLSEFDIRVILSEFLRIPLKYCESVLAEFQRKKELIPFEFEDEEYTLRYSKLLDLIENLSKSTAKISEQIVQIYNQLFVFDSLNKQEINKFNFFLKQITDFENIFGKEFNSRKADIILQIENSIISENPYSILEIAPNDLVISTPQKIIDNHVKTRYQFWLDISSSEWIKSDTGPLYNAWVFQKDWYKEDYTIEDNIELSKDKNARVLRKLSLNALDFIYCYSSLFDSNGVENYGALENYIIVNSDDVISENSEKTFKIIPREDQKPVLDYEKGYMGISAVPGAGKTTILLALILKLLDRKINPEHIFVLTYMDSAARNFRERIKNVRKNSTKLPNISTIHGLALRILKENGNFEKLGLSGDFEICDDSQRGRILREISSGLKIEPKLAEEFDRAVSVFKMGGGVFNDTLLTDNKLKKFKSFFESYQENLREFNLIDYDDMLIGSVRILKENPDVLAHYQAICEYIIEDEAQDSSAIQQELIALLSGKHKNVIRCGDVNQSITATFSNADVDGFRIFITKNNNVSMNCSQRCTKDVWQCANRLVEVYSSKSDSQNSFYKMFMQPVEGRNPQGENAVLGKIFDSPIDEKNYILKVIKNTLAKNPEYTVGILLRNNYQVAAWQNLIENSGLKAITRNQCLEQKTVFKVIFAILNMILHPFDNELVGSNYEILAESGLYQRGLGNEIKKYENPFIRLNADNLENIHLEQFYWDLNYWVSLCYLAPNELAVKVITGFNLFKSDIEKSNIYLISTLIRRICIKNNSLEYAVNRLAELAKKPNLSGFKFFSEEDDEDKTSLQGKVQIMTMHKSKGDEFNLVFLPEMAEKSLPLSIGSINLKSSEFIESIKDMNPNYKRKTEYELKQEILTENLKLLYVAITRAKNKLFISTSSKTKNRFGKEQKLEPSVIFEELLGGVVSE
ncbi:ATP-dependent helicase [bacterium]|nr:ATP-dependent helicase [bacterium]